jgi:dienelactone hydrolase
MSLSRGRFDKWATWSSLRFWQSFKVLVIGGRIRRARIMIKPRAAPAYKIVGMNASRYRRSMARKDLRFGISALTGTLLMLAVMPAMAGQSKAPELTGALSYDVASKSGAVQTIEVMIGDGGSGPYRSVLVGDAALPTHTIYRPRDLQPFGGTTKLPIVAWANGGCRNSSGEFRNFLAEIASHGFLVVAIGPAVSSLTAGNELPGLTTQASQLLDGVDWAIAENSRADSPYRGKIETTKIAVMGQSCGGVQAITVSVDPRVTTSVIWNSGLFEKPTSPPAGAPAAALKGMEMPGKEILAKLHAPIAYFIGGESDIAHRNAADDFAKIQGVPALLANREVGHYPATYREPRGGAFAQAGAAWLKWQLMGDQKAAAMFTGDRCGLCVDPKWTVERKNLQ